MDGRTMKQVIHNFVSDDRGLEMVEYAVLVALIILATVGVIQVLVGALRTEMQAVTTAVGNPG
jgi:Flp pilus assembly pilin Flp